ncbi:extracellular catalytic domain type 2 short-chain-length polyhydroxyalkanoate depolymerase [Rheinheimera sp.]|uniref:extracellular catalytic domain type 2 short-chain-length polyhydroxyalkanoate depolymerase n=1 Tax=Rheinheimera sp. TaxID=1869214 RepID=UPI002FDEE7A5
MHASVFFGRPHKLHSKTWNKRTLQALLAASFVAAGPALAADKTSLPKLTLDKNITLSGLSSGGYMAAQFHLAYSSEVQGAAIVAAGPVYCAANSLQTAFAHCLNQSSSTPDLTAASAYLTAQQQQGGIDALENLADDKVWLFHGTKDSTVAESVSDALAAQYQSLLAKNNLVYVKDKAFAHHFPTDHQHGTDCADSKTPFIGSCGYDAAGAMLNHLLPDLKARAAKTSGQLMELNQQALAPKAKDQLGKTGYLYVPQSCSQGQPCRLHVSFHGCKQYGGAVGDVYARLTGLNEYADSNQLVVFYPQADKSVMNPNGCWDWWGYSGEHYATKNGPQMQAVKQLIEVLQGRR